MKKLFGRLTYCAVFPLLALISVFTIFSCTAKQQDPDPGQIAAVSAGVLNRNDPIKVVFAQSQDTSKPLASNTFVFQPSVKGTASWDDDFTLVFTPSEPLRSGQRYQVRVNADGINPFSFGFVTAVPYMSVNLDPVQVDDSGRMIVKGIVSADEDASIAAIEQTVSSQNLGKPEWTHDSGVHRFAFAPVVRTQDQRTVIISWDGKPLGSAEKGSVSVIIPGIDTFEIMGFSSDNGAIVVSFSSPLKKYNDLRGFISIDGRTDVRYSLNNNVIRIFGNSAGNILPGSEILIQDLEDINGRRMETPVRYTVPEKWELPEVRFAGNGVILPTSQGAQLVVETRNLTGILVEAFQIYGDNMFQFLQVNNLNDTNELDRVGEPVWTKAYDFQWNDTDQNRWIGRGLDISELSKKYPGGMFNIRVSFRLRHVKYECTAGHGDFSNLQFPGDDFPVYRYGGETSYWDNYYNTPGYDWSTWNKYRKDPCHPAFYIPFYDHNITISRNVLVSNLGLLAKRTLDGSWVITATNLINARSSPNTDYKIYNYQGRLLLSGKTGSDGMAQIKDFPEGSGSGLRLIIYAENSLGKAYLKVNDSLTLATSQFDVAGSTPSTGIRGLIYGERGVWRPGDDIYLTFLLSDPQFNLPADHPVSFELEDPRGRITQTNTYTSSVDGFYPIAASTDSDAPTGDWTARVKVGNNTFSKNIKIETVMPNRLKTDLDFSGEDVIKSGPHTVGLGAQWLYGAAASNLKADISVTFADKDTAFSKYPDFSFRDPSRLVSAERQNVWEGFLDNSGNTVFSMNLNPGQTVPGKVTARFLTRVYEPSGVFSSEQTSMEYSPYKRYVGIRLPKGDAARNMLLTDTDHRADIVVLDEDGNPVKGSITLNIAIYKLNWRWWWEKGDGEAAEFSTAISRNPISKGTVNTVNGTGSWSFRVNYPDWGRYMVLVQDSQGGHAAAQTVYIDWPGWAGRSTAQGQGAEAMLTLNTDKPSYITGDKIQVTFPSNKEAGALVILEKGGEIIKSDWVSCGDEMTSYEFSADPSMTPNIYVHVTLLQPHLQTINDLPIRLYGIIPVTIDDPKVVLHPVINAPPNWEAESNVSFSVSEADGRPMAYTVAVVDEGLLGLTRYNLPNPASTFYTREASFLKSWDLFSQIIGAYSGRLETLLAIGGSDDEQMDSGKETQRFKPVVHFFGPYELKAGETRTESFDLPPYTGALRIMVMAASSTAEAVKSQRAYGTAQTSVKVTSDLMVFASLPRTLSPNDEVVVPVYVNSFKDGSRNVKVSLSVPGAIIQGSAVQEVYFTKTGEELLRFRVKAPANPGNLTFTAKAESAGLKSAQHVTDMEVRSTAIPVTASYFSPVSPGETLRGNLNYPGREGTNTLTASFSKLPPLNLESRLDFLVKYPNGCVEQTTSGVFPQLYLENMMELDSSRIAEIRTNVNAGIERIYGFQTASGGFSYWPGGSIPHDWGTSYAGHFLLAARQQGYQVRDSVIKNWLHYQKDRAAVWQPRNNDYSYVEQAYRLYTIALAGEADLGSMNRLRDQKNIPQQASWRLAAAYWYAGQLDTARSMTRMLDLPKTEYRELSATFGSSLRDKAMILETLILLGTGSTGQSYSAEMINRTRSLYEDISKTLSGDRWLSTQETAYALIAAAPYVQNNSGGSIAIDYSAAGRPGNVTITGPSVEKDLGYVTGNNGAFSFTNRSDSIAYVKLSARGLPDEGNEPAMSEGLTLAAEYRDSGGRIINPDNLKTGEDMEVRVTVTNTY
ncbi:MAG: MG2 domain-containing protein, partial [Treponema sp.]|nr:MG2 domain-containing protein [Treponema sp.]